MLVVSVGRGHDKNVKKVGVSCRRWIDSLGLVMFGGGRDNEATAQLRRIDSLELVMLGGEVGLLGAVLLVGGRQWSNSTIAGNDDI